MPKHATQLPSPALPRLIARPLDSHKGNFGRALMIGGSRGMSGSIALSSMAAVRSGAGLVTVAVPSVCLETVASFSPCYMTIPIRDDANGAFDDSVDSIQNKIDSATCLGIGPGIGQAPAAQRFVLEIVNSASTPLVIDADALNALATREDWPKLLPKQCVLTPHPGEWSRLSGAEPADRDRQIRLAIELTAKHDFVLVLKGHETIITDGKTLAVNTTGTPAIATGGTGDVLTGVITALICQGLSPRDAAYLGAHVHGLAGELAERSLDAHVVLPTELIEFLPPAFQGYTDQEASG